MLHESDKNSSAAVADVPGPWDSTPIGWPLLGWLQSTAAIGLVFAITNPTRFWSSPTAPFSSALQSTNAGGYPDGLSGFCRLAAPSSQLSSEAREPGVEDGGA